MLGRKQEEQLRLLQEEMKVANEEYKAALTDAGESEISLDVSCG